MASFLIIQLPGPSLLFMLGRALTVGLVDALLSAVGNAAGLLTQAMAVALGLGAIVADNDTLYAAVKLVGAAYIIWLGIQAIRHRTDTSSALAAGASPPHHPRAAIASGYVVGITNPKTAVFFLAFLPQFTTPGSPAGPQLAVLGLVFAVMEVVSDSIWVTLAGRAKRWLATNPRRLNTMSAAGGGMLITLGAALALT